MASLAPHRESRRTPLWVECLSYAAIAVLCASLGVSGLWDMFRVVTVFESPWWTLLTALPAAALVFTKQGAPLVGCCGAALLAFVDLLATGGVVPFIVMLDMLYALTVSLKPADRRRVLVAVVAVTATTAVGTLLLSSDVRVALVIALQVGALLGSTYWYGTSVAQSRELVALHRQQAEDTKRLAELDRLAAVRHEQERLASELHDIVAGHVSAVAIRSEAALAAGVAGETGIDGSVERTALRAVRDSSLAAHEALRVMIRVLRDGSGDLVVVPGQEGVADMVAEARRSGVRVTLHDELTEGLDGHELPTVVAQTVWRVINEGLANAVKHASGSTIDVQLSATKQQVLARVASRGGAPVERPALRGSGLGLRLLEERVQALEGTVDAGWQGDSWVLSAHIPLTSERDS